MSNDNAKSEPASLESLAAGAEKTLENAEQLFREAELLASAGAVARALCLHQISLEECSKVDALGAWAVSLVVGFEVDQKKILAALARHSSKNKSNAYMMEESVAEKQAKLRGDLEGAIEAFWAWQEEFHQASNKAKNAALYVDWVDGAFAAPSERISNEMLVEIAERNAKFLGYAHNGVRMMRRLARSPNKIKGLLGKFVEQVEELRSGEAEGGVAAMKALLERFLEDGRQELSEEKASQ